MMLLNVFGTGKLCKKLQNMNNKCKTDMITTEKKKEKTCFVAQFPAVWYVWHVEHYQLNYLKFILKTTYSKEKRMNHNNLNF